MRRFLLAVEYHGRDFQGWQLQAHGRSVQGVLEAAVAAVTGASSRVVGAARTDAGVHARAQGAHFDSGTRLPAPELLRAVNALLPWDVALVEVHEVSPTFHARRDALGKTYRYRILNRLVPSPLRREQTWQVRCPLDLDAMREGAEILCGEHDFAAFRGTRGGSDPQERTRRTLDLLEVRCEDDEVQVVAEGRSFLRHMVRALVGTLVEVGQGRRRAGEIEAILASRDRSRAGATAPAHGLCLDRVRYPEQLPKP